MPDTKLSALLSSSAPASFYYGIDASNNSRKFAAPGFYNVKDYGAVGDGLTNDASAIQAAVTAALAAPAGGILFFPPGRYKVDSTINFTGSSLAGLKIMGCGSEPNAAFGGSFLYTDQNIYIFTVTRPTWGSPIASISDIGFQNAYAPIAGSVTSTEGVNGCIYIVNGQGIRFQSCSFNLIGGSGGIAVVCLAQNCVFTSCNFQGSFNGTQHDAIGLFCNNCSVSDCKMSSLSFAVMSAWAGEAFLQMRNIDIEVSGCGVSVGRAWIAFWDMYDGGTGGPGALEPIGTAGYCGSLELISVNMESIGFTDNSAAGCNVYCYNATGVFISGCTWANTDGVHLPQYGLYGLGLSNSLINSLAVAGYASIAGIAVGGKGNVTFHGCSSRVTAGGGDDWKVDLSTGWSVAANGYTYQYCDTDGAMTLANLPISPTQSGQTVLCSDSTDPVWDFGSSASNVGKPITGGGIYKVTARAHSGRLTASGTWTSSYSAITMASTIPAWVVAGMGVYDVLDSLNGYPIGTVASGAGTTTLNLSTSALSGSNSSSDTLQFSQWVIAG